MSRAQEQAAFLIGERGLTETAQAEGRRIVEHAEDVATGIRSGADDYASSVLQTLEQEAITALAGIRKGIDVLQERQAELQQPAAGAGAAAATTDDEPDDRTDEAMAPVTDDEDAGSRSPLLR